MNSIHYAFKQGNGDEDAALTPCMVMVDYTENGMWAFPVDQKGDCQLAVGVAKYAT